MHISPVFYWLVWWIINPLFILSFAILIFNRLKRPAPLLVNATRMMIGLIDWVNVGIARLIQWLGLFMVLVMATLVISRYVFGISPIKAQESVLYMHGLVFMLVAAATLLSDGHVRVDIFYEKASAQTRAWINIIGTLFLLMPVCVLIFYGGRDYAARAWAVHEGSPEASGLHGVYLLKTIIPIFAIMMIAQGSALVARAALILTGQPLPAAQEPS